jgi:hypothetical protein
LLWPASDLAPGAPVTQDLPAKELLNALEKSVTLMDYEKNDYPSQSSAVHD